jgi:hypothetical protein
MYAPFVISSIVEDNPVGDKIDAHNVVLLEQLLNMNLQLSSYGTAVMSIAVVFIGTVPENVIHQEEVTYAADKKELYLQVRLPYTVLLQATESEVLSLMAKKYLQTLGDLATTAPAMDFAWERLVLDVQSLFAAAGLMV